MLVAFLVVHTASCLVFVGSDFWRRLYFILYSFFMLALVLAASRQYRSGLVNCVCVFVRVCEGCLLSLHYV